jgi:lysophospholipid acyltransferase (LPLAT)-like uncharacterized protein
MLKKFLRSPRVQFLIGRLLGAYLNLCAWSTRWSVVNRAGAEAVWDSRAPVLLCVWHGRFMLAHKLWSFKPGVRRPKMLISQSRDGSVVVEASRSVGAEVIRGSAAKGAKRKGGFEASRDMKRWIDGGGIICMTPDGPHGPRMRAKLGVAQLSRITGAAMFPVAWATRGRKSFQSWDRLNFPLPFGRGVLVWGDVIPAPKRGDDFGLEAARLALEEELNRVTAEADRLMGFELIEPAPAPLAGETDDEEEDAPSGADAVSAAAP